MNPIATFILIGQVTTVESLTSKTGKSYVKLSIYAGETTETHVLFFGKVADEARQLSSRIVTIAGKVAFKSRGQYTDTSLIGDSISAINT